MQSRSASVLTNSRGFSQLEFTLLTLGGVIVLGLLAHFTLDQSLQLERLKALVARDSVRLAIESKLQDLNVLIQSAKRISSSQDELNSKLLNIRSCLLGETTCESKPCCVSHQASAMPVYDVSTDSKDSDPKVGGLLTGTKDAPSCLDATGAPLNFKSAESASVDCFAAGSAVVEPLCAGAKPKCDRADAIVISYNIRFLSPFLIQTGEEAFVDRKLSVLIGRNGSVTSP